MAYKKKLSGGTSKFHKHGIKVSWSKDISQEQLELIYNLGYTQFVEKDGEAKPKKKAKSKAAKSSKDTDDKE